MENNLEEQLRQMILRNDAPQQSLLSSGRGPANLASSQTHYGQRERFTTPPQPQSYSQHFVQGPPPGLSHSRNQVSHGGPSQSPSILPSQNLEERLQHPVQNHPRPPNSVQQGPIGSQHSSRDHPRPPARAQQGQSTTQYRQHSHLLDPSSFQRNPRVNAGSHQYHNGHDPRNRDQTTKILRTQESIQRKAHYLEQLALQIIPSVEMGIAERDEKEMFRRELQGVIHQLCSSRPNQLPSVNLQCFGSFQSGFATANSDMDLVIVSQDQEKADDGFSLHESDLPRALEKELLRLGYGARLLTRTRVPIIKICQIPNAELLEKLRAERLAWDQLPETEKYPQPYDESVPLADGAHARGSDTSRRGQSGVGANAVGNNGHKTEGSQPENLHDGISEASYKELAKDEDGGEEAKTPKRDAKKTWTRNRQAGSLDFPSSGTGIQCDINFFNPLGLHNTQLLRCYSKCDPRVRLMVLFVKAWAKKRKINSAYSGTLSSYGYVLMVLHFLMNIVEPAVIPNLQMPWRPAPGFSIPGSTAVTVDGWVIDFWREEHEIEYALHQGWMSQNRDMLGALLAGFFSYYGSQHARPSFRWVQQCLSLRTHGGILSKEDKGWTKATTVETEGRKVQQRYLFCIEDPFELSHNVARTVTHHGIVAIRDEFRRAFDILSGIGANALEIRDGGDLFKELTEAEETVQISPIRPKPRTDPQDPSADRRTRSHREGPKNSSNSVTTRGPVGGLWSAAAPNLADVEQFPDLGSARSHGQKSAMPTKANGGQPLESTLKIAGLARAGSKKKTTEEQIN